MLQDFLHKNFIRPNYIPWRTLVLCDMKIRDLMRLGVGYRQINKVVVKSEYRHLRIDELFDQLQGAWCFFSR